jgi:ABC-type multidrug transport system ATPase subunit
MSAVSLDALSVRRGPDLVVKGVGLAVRQGSWFGLIGANGSGKTSLLRAIGGRLAIDSGSCIVEGVDLSSDRAGRARLFGFAPPPERLPDSLRAGEILELVGGGLTVALDRLGGLREALGMGPLLDRWIGDCSAGMRQRIAIALAFAGGNALVILDEPFNWLDPVAAFDVRTVLRSMVDQGLTLLTALHDLGTLVTSCDEGVMLVDGKVALKLEQATLKRAAENPQEFERQTIGLLRSANRQQR